MLNSNHNRNDIQKLFLLWRRQLFVGFKLEIWYAENMSKKRSNSRKANKETRKARRRSPLQIFLWTFFGVLGAGLCGILLWCLLFKENFSHENSTQEAGADAAGEESSRIWENIPPQIEIPEAVETMRQTEVEEAGIYDDVLADPEYMAANNIYARPNKTEGVVTLGFAGDILFDDEYAMMAHLKSSGGSIESAISEALLGQMRDVDIMMVNNEFPYTDRGTPTEGKTFTFRADPSTVSYLGDMGVDIVSLANNHSYDFGEIGLLDSLDTLKSAGMPYVGAGRNLEEASKPVYFISGDIKIAILSATQIERLENPDTKGATDSSPGVFRCLNPSRLCEAVAQAKQDSDFVIVFIHWGTENVVEPDWAQLDQAPKLAEAGADLIIGAHPHCLQGIQYYGEVPVIYSLGNFWFNSKTIDTGMVRVDITKDGISNFRFIPAIQSNCRTDLAYDAEKTRILSYMQGISNGVVIDQEGFVSKP